MQAVNSDADFSIRHAAHMVSRFHHTAKILLTAAPVWTLMTDCSGPSRGWAYSSLDAWSRLLETDQSAAKFLEVEETFDGMAEREQNDPANHRKIGHASR
jgi:hypothetical protein